MKPIQFKFKTLLFLLFIGFALTSCGKLLTKKDILSAFELSEEIEIKQSADRNAICSYKWQTMDEKYNTLMLNFASGGKRTKGQIDKAWEGPNKGVYKKHKPQNVSGVGDRASWSDLGGGQLRVASDGNIFYVPFFVFPKNKDPRDTQEMIDKASALAERVLKRI